MIQTQQNGKRTHLGLALGHLGPQFFFSEIWLHQSLNIMVRYHYVHYHKKLTIQSGGKLVTVGREDRRTRVISKDAVRLLSSVQRTD